MNSKDYRDLLAEAVVAAVPGIKDALGHVIYRHEQVLPMVLTTLARLRFMQISLLQTALEETGAELSAAAMLEDVEKMVIVSMLASKSITPELAKKIGRGAITDEVIEKATKGPQPYKSHEDAQKVLSEALAKLKAQKDGVA